MVEGLDRSFSACFMIGYHARAGSGGNPLAHTMSLDFTELRLNERPLSEFALYALAAELEGVPTTFVSGDSAICEDIKSWNSQILTVATSHYFGTTCQVLAHPDTILEELKLSAEKSLAAERLEACHVALSEKYSLEVDYKEPWKAYQKSFYPGARLVGDRTVQLNTADYFDVIRAVQFL